MVCRHCRAVEAIMAQEPDRDWAKVVVMIKPLRKCFWFPNAGWLLWRRETVGYAYLYGDVRVEMPV